MTKTYAQLVKQIETLQQEADKARRTEIEGVVKRIREAISVYNLTAADLGLAIGGEAKRRATPAKRVKAKKAGKTVRASAGVKYRNEAGATWGGIGKRPQWLRDALAAGRKLEEFAVK